VLTVFDGHHLYSNTWNPPSDLLATNRKFAARVDAAGADRVWVATVMPGYNDVKIRPGSGFAQDREGGAYYVRGWQAAIDGGAEWVVINSFNEWPEGSYIEPSAAFGRQYLDLTATWSSQFKGACRHGAERRDAARAGPFRRRRLVAGGRGHGAGLGLRRVGARRRRSRIIGVHSHRRSSDDNSNNQRHRDDHKWRSDLHFACQSSVKP
jgi:hypothetical protein